MIHAIIKNKQGLKNCKTIILNYLHRIFFTSSCDKSSCTSRPLAFDKEMTISSSVKRASSRFSTYFPGSDPGGHSKLSLVVWPAVELVSLGCDTSGNGCFGSSICFDRHDGLA